jgi:hypothetical protein
MKMKTKTKENAVTTTVAAAEVNQINRMSLINLIKKRTIQILKIKKIRRKQTIQNLTPAVTADFTGSEKNNSRINKIICER